VRFIGCSEKSIWKKYGEEIPVAYLTLEYIKGGELAQYVIPSQGMSEGVCKYFFR